MLRLASQNPNLFAGVVTACFYLRGYAFSLGVSTPASTSETPVANTERIFF